jgi:hypothetical protein
MMARPRHDGVKSLLLALPLLAGCTMAPVTVGVGAEFCAAGTMPATVAEAFFGRSSGGREAVDDAAWARFLDEVVTPAFPDGLTVLDAAGQWRTSDGRVARERSKVLIVALPGATPDRALARLAPVTAAYRARFAQESVMVTTRSGCVGF